MDFDIFILQKLQKEKKEKCSMDVVKDEIMKELNWKERIIVKLFAKTFEKVYKLGITFGFNNK